MTSKAASNILTKINYKFLGYIAIALIATVALYYLVNLYGAHRSKCINTDALEGFITKKTHEGEGFRQTSSKGVEGFQAAAPAATLSAEQLALCPAGATSLINGFRSLYSGATFKMERVNEATTTDYFICGPGKFVIMRKEGTNALQLSIRDTSGRIPNQIFIKSTVPNPAGSGNCIIFQAKDSNGLYVQYEHEHISLRPLNTDGKPFIGQCFTEYNVSNAELEANALALGVSAARLGNEELYGAGYDNTIVVPPGAEGALADSGDELASAADKRTEDALSSITGTLNELKQKLGGTQPTQNVFGTGGPIQINLDVAGLEDEKAAFQDLAVGSGTASVRELLDQYTNMGDSLQLGGIPAVGDLSSSKKMLEIRQALQSKFKGCPGIDRNKFYTEKQLAQCAGCNPDAFLRGQLGGLPK